jgi:serine/threonine protein kinase
LDYFSDDNYVYLVTELFGTSWETSNPLLLPEKHVGLRRKPRLQPLNNCLLTYALKESTNRCASTREPIRSNKASMDLFECIDSHYALPEQVVRYIFVQIVDTVAYLHSQGVFHRDLKDENILVDEHYRIKIVDFGSACVFLRAQEDKKFHTFYGTLQFAAPEVLHGKPYSGLKAEVWTLGILLYTMIFACNPFPSPDHVLKGHLDPPASYYHNLKKGYCSGPPIEKSSVWDLVQKCLAPIPEERLDLEGILAHPWLR